MLKEWSESIRVKEALKIWDYVIPHNVNLILIPKCESADYVRKAEDEIENIKERYKLTNNVLPDACYRECCSVSKIRMR